MLITNVSMKVKFTLTLTNVTLAKDQISGERYQAQTIGPLVLNMIRHFKRSNGI